MVPSKSGQSVHAIQNVAASGFVIGSAIDITSKIGGRVRWRFGRDSVTIFVNPPIFRVEASPLANGVAVMGDWVEIRKQSVGVGSSLGSQAVSGTVNAAQPAILLAAVTNFAKGDRVFIKNTTIANSEWGIVSAISGNTITLEENLKNAQTGSTVSNGANVFDSGPLDLTAYQSLRLCVEGEANAAVGFNFDAYVSFFDSFS